MYYSPNYVSITKGIVAPNVVAISSTTTIAPFNSLTSGNGSVSSAFVKSSGDNLFIFILLSPIP